MLVLGVEGLLLMFCIAEVNRVLVFLVLYWVKGWDLMIGLVILLLVCQVLGMLLLKMLWLVMQVMLLLMMVGLFLLMMVGLLLLIMMGLRLFRLIMLWPIRLDIPIHSLIPLLHLLIILIVRFDLLNLFCVLVRMLKVLIVPMVHVLFLSVVHNLLLVLMRWFLLILLWFFLMHIILLQGIHLYVGESGQGRVLIPQLLPLREQAGV